jgi:hypothetical protein
MPDETKPQLDVKWLLIQERLKAKDLVKWLRQFRGSRATNPKWQSWDSIAHEIFARTDVSVTAQGLRRRFADLVDDDPAADDTGGAVPPQAAAPPVTFTGA